MAITSRELLTSATGGGRRGRRIGISATLAAGAAILGCAAMLAFGGPSTADGAQAGAVWEQGAAAGIWTGACRAGSSDCLPDLDYAVPAEIERRPRAWTGGCRAGGVDCLPDEDDQQQESGDFEGGVTP